LQGGKSDGGCRAAASPTHPSTNPTRPPAHPPTHLCLNQHIAAHRHLGEVVDIDIQADPSLWAQGDERRRANSVHDCGCRQAGGQAGRAGGQGRAVWGAAGALGG
jgi:hypothetical protein